MGINIRTLYVNQRTPIVVTGTPETGILNSINNLNLMKKKTFN